MCHVAPRTVSFSSLAALAILLPLAGATAQSGAGSCALSWQSTFGGEPGASSYVYALATLDDGSGPALYAGGNFSRVVGVPARGVAQWNGTRWAPLGGGINGSVFAFAVFDDGSGPALYAGGSFLTANGAPGNNIAKWNGATWTSPGSGVTGSFSSVTALAVFDDGSGPALYVGGRFTNAGGVTVSGIAKWNGTSWASVGIGFGTNGIVSALAVHDDGSGPALYAGGSFSTPLGAPANSIAKWNGASWTALGSGMTGSSVSALAVCDDGSGPALYAGGAFISAGGVSAAHIARWNGASWSAVGGGTNNFVLTLTPLATPGGTLLCAGGGFTQASGVAANGVAAWNGATWSALGGGVTPGPTSALATVYSLAVFDDGSGVSLYAGGDFQNADGLPATDLARWNGASWSALGKGLDDRVSALAAFDDGTGSALYAGGRFTVAGGQTLGHIAKWDGASWSSMGGGVTHTNPSLAWVDALAVFDDGTGPALYAGGTFDHAGGVLANHIAKWNGATWSPLGSGAISPLGPSVDALAVFDDGSGAALYAGGSFTSMGGVVASNIAKWNGSSWSPLGNGVPGLVQALAIHDDGSGPALYAGGLFFSMNQTFAGLWKWDGASWVSLMDGLPGRVNALAVYDDGSGPALYAGGAFLLTQSSLNVGIAKWDGATLVTPWGGLQGSVGALATFDDGNGSKLYASSTSSTNQSSLVQWTGTGFTSIGALDNSGEVLTTFDGGGGSALYLGGVFASSPAGDSYLARFGCTAGARLFGNTSPGCSGAVTLGVSSVPRVGNLGFALTGTGAPLFAPGVLLAGLELAAPVPILAVQIWVSPLLALPVASGFLGMTTVPIPIPSEPALAGVAFGVQTIWAGPTGPAPPPPCPPLGLSASQGLALVIQP